MMIINKLATIMYMGIVYAGVPGVFLYHFLMAIAAKGI